MEVNNNAERFFLKMWNVKFKEDVELWEDQCNNGDIGMYRTRKVLLCL